jgi:hypothetical protein
MLLQNLDVGMLKVLSTLLGENTISAAMQVTINRTIKNLISFIVEVNHNGLTTSDLIKVTFCHKGMLPGPKAFGQSRDHGRDLGAESF